MCLFSFLGPSPHMYILNVSVFLLHKCCRHLSAVFPHTLWLAPLTAFGNVCLQSLASLHLEHAPGELPDLCAIRLVVISCASALLSPMRMVQLSVLCHREAKVVISAPILASRYCCPLSKRSSPTYKTDNHCFQSVVHSLKSDSVHTVYNISEMELKEEWRTGYGLFTCQHS